MSVDKKERLIEQLERLTNDLKNGKDFEIVRNDLQDSLLQSGKSLSELAKTATYDLLTEKINDMDTDTIFYSSDFLNEGRDYDSFISLTTGNEKQDSLMLNGILFYKEHDPLYKKAERDINYSINSEEGYVDTQLELIINIEEGSKTYFNGKLEELGIDKEELNISDLKEIANSVAKDIEKAEPYSKEEIENNKANLKEFKKEEDREY